jgi:hypothetical protein
MASSINASTSGGGGVIVTSDATGNLDIQSGGSTVVAVTSAGVAVTGTLSATGASTFTGTGKFATTIGVGNATPAASGSGITFPATQSASSDANTLDDYEEGTFTPAYTGGLSSVTYGITQNGYYRKIGGLVTIWFGLQTDALTVTTAGLLISGLPFTSISGVGYTATVNIVNSSRWASGPPITGIIGSSLSVITLYSTLGAVGAGTDPVPVTTANLSTGSGNRNMCFGTATYAVV